MTILFPPDRFEGIGEAMEVGLGDATEAAGFFGEAADKMLSPRGFLTVDWDGETEGEIGRLEPVGAVGEVRSVLAGEGAGRSP